jgi:hypothetical protein
MGEDLPESFRFTITAPMAVCFAEVVTVADARGAVPSVDARLGNETLTCTAAADDGGTWSISCSNSGGSVEIRLAQSLMTGEVVVDRGGTACDVTLPMATVEILAP